MEASRSTSAPEPAEGRAPARFTRQTWTAAVAAVLFVLLGLTIAFTPVPFVVWSPGGAYDLLSQQTVNGQSKPAVEISGVTTCPTNGQLYMLTVSESRPDSLVTLPQALIGFWMRSRDVLPRDFLYPPGKSSQQVDVEDSEQMFVSQQDAVVAALREAGQKVDEVPVVTAVTNSGPASGILRTGDVITRVDATDVKTAAEITAAIGRKQIGQKIGFTVLRSGQRLVLEVEVRGSNQDRTIPVVGAKFGVGYAHAASVKINIDPAIGGPSGGLMFALTIYDRLTPHNIAQGRAIAGTGEITSTGEVKAIGGIQEKVAAAEKVNASVFLAPAANCPDLAGFSTKLRVVRVDNLAQAVRALADLNNPATAASVPTC